MQLSHEQLVSSIKAECQIEDFSDLIDSIYNVASMAADYDNEKCRREIGPALEDIACDVEYLRDDGSEEVIVIGPGNELSIIDNIDESKFSDFIEDVETGNDCLIMLRWNWYNMKNEVMTSLGMATVVDSLKHRNELANKKIAELEDRIKFLEEQQSPRAEVSVEVGTH